MSAKTSSEWSKIGVNTALHVFKNAAKNVPAYKNLLKKTKVNPLKIKKWTDFTQSVPLTSKKDYLRTNALPDVMRKGSVSSDFFTYSASSGSTGKPQFYPRDHSLAIGYSKILEEYLDLRPSDSTLIIITFGMGVWIGGIHTFEAFYEIGRKRNISIITPGVNKEEIHRTIEEIGKYYEQIVIAGYPPFIKDLVDELNERGTPIQPNKIRLLFAAEVFTEAFRNYVVDSVQSDNALFDTMNIYGTADIGAMARETPTSILVRRLAIQHDLIRSEIFGNQVKIPTFAQYNPELYCFENVDGGVFVTADNGIPLIRYALGDLGGVVTFDEVASIFKRNSIDIAKEAKKVGILLSTQPFVFVFERSDFSVKLYGATIYPEHIREALQIDILSQEVTGKFAMQMLSNENMDQYLEINIELRAGKDKSVALEKQLVESIQSSLLLKNAEYRNNFVSMGNKVVPKIVLWPHESPTYFKPNIKQKWVIKE